MKNEESGVWGHENNNIMFYFEDGSTIDFDGDIIEIKKALDNDFKFIHIGNAVSINTSKLNFVKFRSDT